MDFTKQSGVKSSFCTAFAHRKLSLKSYSSFRGLKIRICGVKGIKARLEILIYFCKIYVYSELLSEHSASYNFESYILRKIN
ncbi:hypothetical protein JTS97_01830 [Clostridium botulinum]|nr:hypothetical protein [Clostridium botulinum]